MVSEGKGIELLVAEPVVRHFEGLMAGERLEGHVPRLGHLSACYHLISAACGHTIVGSPLALAGLTLGEVGCAGELTVARGHQIAFLVHDGDVSAVEVTRVVALALQAAGQ